MSETRDPTLRVSMRQLLEQSRAKSPDAAKLIDRRNDRHRDRDRNTRKPR